MSDPQKDIVVQPIQTATLVAAILEILTSVEFVMEYVPNARVFRVRKRGS